ncbi:MAG TPA: lysophospholipid acyltransferase family protein [Aliidongia sp.]|nr:lysophospholipid acyltransferase family protein [Aliidongia sp.]
MNSFPSNLLRSVRLGAYLLFTLFAMPVQAIALLCGLRGFTVGFPLFYHRTVVRILGFRLNVRGRLSTAQPTLFVTNHSSYLDIEMFGAVIPGSFVAKSEVKGWPLFGWLARLQRTVFVDRRVRSSAEQRDSLAARLQSGDNVILFPEGTSNDGTRLRPFKSALFSAAEIRVESRPVTVQPVTLSYTKLNGMPIGRDIRPLFAWFGDMELVGHLWTVAGLGITDIVIEFHPPVTIDCFGSRKKLAEHCERVIAEGLSAANSGRLAPLGETVPDEAPRAVGGAEAMTAT